MILARNMDSKQQPQDNSSLSTDNESVVYLRDAIAKGKHWFTALLESIAMWTLSEENYKDRQHRYLIGGEAFDWLLLAERLLSEVSGLVPQEEMIALLFHSKFPIDISDDEFHRLIGHSKYRGQLNYFYGVTVEEGLMLAVEEEVRKEQFVRGIIDGDDLQDEVFQRLYGAFKSELLNKFRKEEGYAKKNSLEFYELKEFTYWLFKFRVNNSDRARIASDVVKGMRELERQRQLGERRRGGSRE